MTLTEEELSRINDAFQMEVKNKLAELSNLKFALGIPGEAALKQLGINNTTDANHIWNKYLANYSHTILLIAGRPLRVLDDYDF